LFNPPAIGAYDEEAHLRAVLTEDGHFIKGQRGGLVAHPAVSMLRAVVAEVTKLEGLCALNPSDRGRLGLAESRAESVIDELLRKRGG